MSKHLELAHFQAVKNWSLHKTKQHDKLSSAVLVSILRNFRTRDVHDYDHYDRTLESKFNDFQMIYVRHAVVPRITPRRLRASKILAQHYLVLVYMLCLWKSSSPALHLS